MMRPRFGRRRHAFALVAQVALALALGAAPLRAQDRELHWRRLDVVAHLDRDGILHVKETQVIVFTGDWNGGERTFNHSAPQRFTFERMVHLDTLTGRERAMTEGNTDVVDGYRWADSRRLRWRARLETDPPFNADERTYRLDFNYRNILLEEGSTGKSWRLDHDFAFTDHQGPIEAFTLKLTLDPVWKAPADFTGAFGPVPLEAWYGYVVNIPLTYTGEGRPAGVVTGAPAVQRYALSGAYVAALLALLAWFFRREGALGRFATLDGSDVTDVIDEKWLNRVILMHPPEVIGAAWDESTGAAEVTAVLARLEQEGKIKSRVESKKLWIFTSNTLHMQLLVDRDELRDYERALIDGLFFGWRTEVTSDEIRSHYSKTGFNPAGKIEARLKEMMYRLVKDDEPTPVPPWWITPIVYIAGALLIFSNVTTRNYDLVVGIPGLFAATIVFLPILLPAAAAWRSRIDGAAGATLWFLVPLALLSSLFLVVTLTGFKRVGITVLLGLALVGVAATYGTLQMAMWRRGTRWLRLRREMARARRWFAEELRKPEPALKDAWFPWLIGLGLATQMDGWFKAFGGASAHSVSRSSSFGSGASGSSWSSGGGSSGSSSWSGLGGGGGFAGGGSSGMWVAAASSVAAGVSKPSSSGGGGSSSGGGSSGGGGGGGW